MADRGGSAINLERVFCGGPSAPKEAGCGPHSADAGQRAGVPSAHAAANCAQSGALTLLHKTAPVNPAPMGFRKGE